MDICKLCSSAIANKKNSHVIPHFLIQSMVNVDGIKDRDRELSIAVGKESITEYFGSAVSPEKIEQYKGCELSDEEIEKQKHHFTVDYFFCSKCETRLATIESYYSIIKSNEAEGIIVNDIDSKLAFLFWASVVWRLSATNKTEFKLKGKEENSLRNLLDKCLDLKESEIMLNAESFKNNISNYAYILLRCPDDANSQKGFCYGHPKFQMPYSLVLNKYVLLFYISQRHINQIKQTFFGFEKVYENAPINLKPVGKEIILKISKETYESSIEDFVNEQSSDFLKNLGNRINNFHKQLIGSNCPPPVIKRTIERIVGENPSILGGRYDDKRIVKIFSEEFIRFSS